jgi:hypothetical protein
MSMGNPGGRATCHANAEKGMDEKWYDVRVPSSATGPDQPDPRKLEPWNLHSSLRGCTVLCMVPRNGRTWSRNQNMLTGYMDYHIRELAAVNQNQKI